MILKQVALHVFLDFIFQANKSNKTRTSPASGRWWTWARAGEAPPPVLRERNARAVRWSATRAPAVVNACWNALPVPVLTATKEIGKSTPFGRIYRIVELLHAHFIVLIRVLNTHNQECNFNLNCFDYGSNYINILFK